MKKLHLYPVFFSIALALLLSGCPVTSSPGSISGTVRDAISGAPISGATVVVSAANAVTGADGAFSFSYPDGGTITADVLVYHGTVHQFWGVFNVSIDVSANPVYNFYLLPNNYGGYPLLTISGDLPVATAGTNASLSITVANSLGGISSNSVAIVAGAAVYSIPIPTFGPDCVIAVAYDDDAVSPIIQYYDHQDLSVALALDLTDLADTAVTVNGTAGDIFRASLDLSIADIEQYVPITMLAGASTVVNIYNNGSHPLIWQTLAASPDTPVAGYQTIRVNIGPSTAFSPSVTLPAPASTVSAPSTIVDPLSVAWASGTSTVSFTAAAGATLHVFEITSNAGYEGRILIGAPDTSIVLPAGFMTDVIGTGLGWDGRVMAIGSTSASGLGQLVDMRIGSMGPANMVNFQLAMVMGNGVIDVITDLIP